jgi:uncharacterized delta-60 repeat protein
VRALRLGLLTLLALARPWSALGAAGDLDPRFGDAGRVRLECCARALAIQPDGRIVLGGQAEDDGDPYLALTRLTATGAVDQTFGDDGVTRRADVPTDDATVVALQPDGKIVAAGIGPGPRIVLVRFDEGGVIDDGFGEGGVAEREVDALEEGIEGVVFQADGTILVLGSVGLVGPDDYQCLLAAFHGDGTPDEAFAGGDLVISSLLCVDLALQGGGPAVLQGHPFFDSGVTLYDPEGISTLTISLDLGPFDDQFNALRVQPDGNVVVAGNRGVAVRDDGSFDTIFDAVVVRARPEGTLDPSFGFAGVATVPLGGPEESEVLRHVALQSDGKLVVAGEAATPFLARFTAGGLPDQAFGAAGVVARPFGDSLVDRLAADPDDNVVAKSGRVLARFIGAPSCGDRIVDRGEACDGGPGCAADCTLGPPTTTTSSSTTTTIASTGPSSTVPRRLCTSDCDDADPCTTDACVSLACVHTDVAGVAGVHCPCQRPAPTSCAGTDLPRKIDRHRERACASAAELTASSESKKVRKITGRIAKRWRASVRRLDRARAVPQACADGLRSQFVDAAERAESLRAALAAAE